MIESARQTIIIQQRSCCAHDVWAAALYDHTTVRGSNLAGGEPDVSRSGTGCRGGRRGLEESWLVKPLKPDDQLEIERLGGLAGMGLPGSRIRSHAQLACRDLNAKEHSAVAALFGIEKKVGTEKKSSDTPEAGADRFRYRLTLHGDGAPQQIEVPESALPESLQARVQDELV